MDAHYDHKSQLGLGISSLMLHKSEEKSEYLDILQYFLSLNSDRDIKLCSNVFLNHLAFETFSSTDLGKSKILIMVLLLLFRELWRFRIEKLFF